VGLTTDDERDRAAEIAPVVGLSPARDGGEPPPSVRAERVEYLHRAVNLHDGNPEERAGRRPYDFGAVRVDRIAAEHYSGGSGCLRTANERTGVAGIGDVD